MKKFIFTFLYMVGVVQLIGWWNRRRVMILCYHGVTERAERDPRDRFGLHVREDRFVVHLEHLRRRYRVISLPDFLAAAKRNRSLPDYSVVLTFDDGYRNFLTAAAPRLAALGMPASVFLITDCVRRDDKGAPWRGGVESDDETYLSWGETRALRERGIEFGSHTCSHRKLSQLPAVEAERELRDSQTAMATHLTEEALPLAYPYGAYSDAVTKMARSLGYVCGLTTDAGGNDTRTDLFALRRTLIGDDDNEALFAARVSGLTWLLGRALAPLRRRRHAHTRDGMMKSYAD